MSERKYKVWPMWVPKSFEVDKPTSEYIREWATIRPKGVAISFYGRDIIYDELNRLIDKAAWGLVDLGVEKGDRVAIHMDNCPQFVIAYFGVQRAGGVVVPVNPMFKPAELEHELNDAGAKALIGLDSLYEDVEKIRFKTGLKTVVLTSLMDYAPEKAVFPLPFERKRKSFADTVLFDDFLSKSEDGQICRVDDLKKDLALLQYTGGTTGIPKGAMISHHMLSYVSVGTAYWYHHREDDVHLAVTPLFHVMGQQVSMCTPLVSGGRAVLLTRFIPEAVAQAIEHYGCTVWVAATTMIIALLSIPNIGDYNMKSLRCLNTGGSSVSLELQRKMSELLPTTLVGEGYGMSETLPQGGATTPFYRYKPGFVGIAQLNEAKIVDLETGTKEMPPNEQGELIVKGPAVMKGYWNKPEETRDTIVDSWLHTGDIALMDEDGYIKLLGRKREMIKCSGFSVFPAEVEDLLYRHPAVKEVAVIGVDDSYRGSSPKAFIILKPDYVNKVTTDDILDWCKDNMATYKRPRFIEFMEDLPRSSAGKVLKRLLA
ncbi:MAG: Long-chain-fatty-acid--CoA ligase [Syntrophorhabdaceae bacterium PtaU1.Bin034]|nr:MAG: Long-chain-fatty-acid--CoA ligase [Syntrophorhabdaceae bacterium PtaU1.Bin034]